MSVLDRLSAAPGVYWGQGRGSGGGRFVARVLVQGHPDASVTFDYETWSPEGGLQHAESARLARTGPWVTLVATSNGGDDTMSFREGDQGVFGSVGAQRVGLIITPDGDDLAFSWWWAAKDGELREQSRAVVSPMRGVVTPPAIPGYPPSHEAERTPEPAGTTMQMLPVGSATGAAPPSPATPTAAPDPSTGAGAPTSHPLRTTAPAAQHDRVTWNGSPQSDSEPVEQPVWPAAAARQVAFGAHSAPAVVHSVPGAVRTSDTTGPDRSGHDRSAPDRSALGAPALRHVPARRSTDRVPEPFPATQVGLAPSAPAVPAVPEDTEDRPLSVPWPGILVLHGSGTGMVAQRLAARLTRAAVVRTDLFDRAVRGTAGHPDPALRHRIALSVVQGYAATGHPVILHGTSTLQEHQQLVDAIAVAGLSPVQLVEVFEGEDYGEVARRLIDDH
ncbi:MAG: hypothetical protein ACRC35_09000 [Angustibacter sp.]